MLHRERRYCDGALRLLVVVIVVMCVSTVQHCRKNGDALVLYLFVFMQFWTQDGFAPSQDVFEKVTLPSTDTRAFRRSP